MSTAYGYSGFGSFVFFIDEIGGYGSGGYGGSIASPANPDAADTHIPLNSLTELSFDIPKYSLYEQVLMGDSVPTRQSQVFEVGSLSLTTIYHAPFLMSRFFSNVTTSGAWASTSETITMNLTNWETTTDSIALHVHVENRDTTGDDLDLNMFGGQIKSYEWSIESGAMLMENVELSFNQTTTGAIAYNTGTGYHNKKFALWNTDRLVNSDLEALAVQQKKVSITTTTTIDAAIASYSAAKITLKAERFEETGIGFEQLSLTAKKNWDVEATMTVKPKDDLMVLQLLSRFEDRLVVPFKMQITEGSRSEYIQCTNMRLSDIGTISIPEASSDAVMQLELTFLPTAESVVQYVGTFNASGGTSIPTTYIKGFTG